MGHPVPEYGTTRRAGARAAEVHAGGLFVVHGGPALARAAVQGVSSTASGPLSQRHLPGARSSGNVSTP